jgi:hypothetical protein
MYQNNALETYAKTSDVGNETDSIKMSGIEEKAGIPFEGVSRLELEASLTKSKQQNFEIDKMGAICVFYICKLPFIKC